MNIYFGQDRTFCFSTIDEINLYLKIPILEGYSIIHYSSELGKNYTEQDFNLLQTNSQLMGVSTVPITYPLEDIAYKTYLSLLELTQDWNLCRIGNYVPYINDESKGLENYKSFCKGRSLAFESFYGTNFCVKLPAATGIGIADDTYAIYFIAVKENISNVENPEQVSAYKYPPQYRPRSPSFARGTVIKSNGKRIGYLSGTASIKGHKSVGKGNIEKQFEVTLDNMKLVFERMGFNPGLPDPMLYDRSFTIYIRHPSDLPVVQQMVKKNFAAADRLIYLHSDICRSELDIEIEAIITEK
ncbi:MAG: hypothetical protein F6K25_27920 [Okeania sp. SIO2G4]|uniref:chorismate transformation enzyme, FkbO/Hyg5 family n=1 Tax=unclassified Okeania TaxID=2634635 RepID=UPI0013BC9D6E|nr:MULTISPECIES: hypothetical protein [unclassified Okeania]NEP07979.1 hypothetical protein [Okeania sp. SIO4D6]NEP41337.1 hypothetical protein [Okeania sp. SIO2H7]NEP75424.1 hypothetical protein [Okeania sp. SIO2G5]NEP96522.1 hypothetical protein [Okeania sp. SIO2F5]NEQ94270.1 hypothetical protein [Okeania sp. SIO2G4]